MEYVRCVCVWLGAVWMRGLGLGFTNPVGTGGVLDVCLYLGCGGVGGVGGECSFADLKAFDCSFPVVIPLTV